MCLLGSYKVIYPLHEVDYVRHGRAVAVGIVDAVAFVVGGPEVSDGTTGSSDRGIALIPDATVDKVRHRIGIAEDVLRVSTVLDNTHLFFELTTHEHYG